MTKIRYCLIGKKRSLSLFNLKTSDEIYNYFVKFLVASSFCCNELISPLEAVILFAKMDKNYLTSQVLVKMEIYQVKLASANSAVRTHHLCWFVNTRNKLVVAQIWGNGFE